MRPLQIESPSYTTRATSWALLPVELRRMILTLVRFPISGRSHDGLGSPKVARFATVCKEWQALFEPHTFRRLVLDADSLDEFGTIIRRHNIRLGCLRKLWLRVQLAKYDCPDCDVPEDEATQLRNNMIFTTCIQSLLATLKLWDPAKHGPEGLALMLSASSPSDTEHRFSQCEIKENYPFHYEEDLLLAPGIVDVHRTNIVDPFRSHFHRGCPPPLEGEHVKRLQGAPLRLQPQRAGRGRFISPYKRLPVVPIVKGLVMRRQFRRNIHIATLSWLLGRSFVKLEWFRLERIVFLDPRMQISFDKSFQLHLLPSLPKTLRQFTFVQWDIPETERAIYLEEEMESKFSPDTQVYLSREMAKLCQRLEQFCPPWQMDTAAFLRDIIELGKSCEGSEIPLKRVILRSLFSSSDRARQDFESLVLLAAKAALSLPRLEVLELWGSCLDGEGSLAYIFQYVYEGGRANIVWRSCEETRDPPARVIAKWSEVAQKHCHSTLTHNAIPFRETKTEISRSEGSFIYRYLLLKDLVFDPITQRILENEPYNWRFDEKSSSSLQGDGLNLNVSNPDSLYDHLSTDSFGQDTNIASLQADLLVWEADVDNFAQQFHG